MVISYHAFFKFDKELEKLVTKKKGQKKSDYLKTSSKLELGTHPPAQILTIYFLTMSYSNPNVTQIIYYYVAYLS